MFEVASPRLAALLFLERVQRADLARTQRWIEQERKRAAEEAARRPPPPPPDWVIAYVRRGADKPRLPEGVHIGGCTMAPGEPEAITREQALAALAEGVPACAFCRPDSELGVLE
ncbi:DUF6233 domain-containing protein [Streptomyces melanogenes]|uniref:DUF6233 domain-containing protein n=1 Tax=Streptomyces melanogenes TaxID=67326 RepID=UPI00167E67B5|nr:DUF6233 domain-containing protein [Streptomyces melanogenes]GGP59369.1 hypothetical protein GCM10010278_40600 [Streptomyces melanogenes]